MRDSVFLDSNVLLYGLDNSAQNKNTKVFNLLKVNECFISPQVIFECLNVASKKFKLSKNDALSFISLIMQFTEIVNEDSNTVAKALELYGKYSLQVFDSKIVATGLLVDCKILYSEDMQHGLVIENKLRIVNPFI